MKKFFTLIALALCAQASMAQDVIASFTFPDEHLTAQESKASGKAEGAVGTNCTVDYSSVGGWKSDGTAANSAVLEGKYYHKLGSDNSKITFKLNSGKFQAGDKFTATMFRANSGTDGFYFKVRTTGNSKTIDYNKTAEVTLEYTLVADDINDDGTLTIARYSTNCYARHFEFIRSGEGGGGDDPTPTTDNALLKEYFDYAENSALEGQGGWQVSTKGSEADGVSPIVVNHSIVYAGYDGSGTGKAALFNNALQGCETGSRNSLVPFITEKPAVNDVFYAAFLGDFSNTATTSGKEIFSFIKQGAAAEDGTTARGRVWVKISEEGNKSFAIRKNGQTIVTYSAETPKTDAALLVVKYINKGTSGSSTDALDEFYLFVNPDPSKTEAENAAVKMDALGNDADGGADLRYVCFRQTKLNVSYAGLRVAKTWEDAVKYKSATAIEQVAAKKFAAKNEFFNLAGQRVAQPTKGLYIVNGKKVVVK